MAYIIDHYGWYYGTRQRCSIQDFPVMDFQNRQREAEYENLKNKGVVAASDMAASIRNVVSKQGHNAQHCRDCEQCRNNLRRYSMDCVPFASIDHPFLAAGVRVDSAGFIMYAWRPFKTEDRARNAHLTKAARWLESFDGDHTCSILSQRRKDRESFRKSGIGLGMGVNPSLMVLTRPMLNSLAKIHDIPAVGTNDSLQRDLTRATEKGINFQAMFSRMKHKDIQKFVKKHIPTVAANQKKAQLCTVCSEHLTKKGDKFASSTKLPGGVVELIEAFL